jgi:hypothetical protein
MAPQRLFTTAYRATSAVGRHWHQRTRELEHPDPAGDVAELDRTVFRGRFPRIFLTIALGSPTC